MSAIRRELDAARLAARERRLRLVMATLDARRAGALRARARTVGGYGPQSGITPGWRARPAGVALELPRAARGKEGTWQAR